MIYVKTKKYILYDIYENQEVHNVYKNKEVYPIQAPGMR